MDNFVNVSLKKINLDTYYIRTSIFKALKEASTEFSDTLLDIGCGKMPYKEYLLKHTAIDSYVGLDIETALEYEKGVQPDYTWDGITMPFDTASFYCAFGTEVLEHCPEPEVVLKEVLRVLKPGGVFFFTVPFLWNLHEVPQDEYRYTPFSLERHLKNVGFTSIKIKATGGWHASMAQMLGLWVQRSPMGKRNRRFLRFFLLPVIRYLFKKDDPKVSFKNGQMITGLSGLAYKK